VVEFIVVTIAIIITTIAITIVVIVVIIVVRAALRERISTRDYIFNLPPRPATSGYFSATP
jgi:hypothetical protein